MEQERKDLLLEQLRTNPNGVTVNFTKVNGEKRTMPCTLNPSLIPAEFAPKNSGKESNPSNCPVFCLDKQQWRSFRFDSVSDFEFNLA